MNYQTQLFYFFLFSVSLWITVQAVVRLYNLWQAWRWRVSEKDAMTNVINGIYGAIEELKNKH